MARLGQAAGGSSAVDVARRAAQRRVLLARAERLVLVEDVLANVVFEDGPHESMMTRSAIGEWHVTSRGAIAGLRI